ncbi:MAG: ABC transporter permease [Bryobacteraceae bacterium]|nr:ABC transporter permease [Bryobacteraceae bacterium]
MAHYYHTALTAFRVAFDSLRAHKLRTFLTLLGVIIGVSSVVMVGAAIEGLGNFAEQTTAKTFGSDSFLFAQIATGQRLTAKERADKLRRNKPVRSDDLDYLRITTGDQILYSPYVQKFEDVKGLAGGVLEACTVIGASATLPEIRDLVIDEGRFFTELEERSSQAVAVVGQDIRKELFPATNPIGKYIKISGIDFRIVGLQEKLGTGATGGSQDNQVIIPITVYDRLWGTQRGMSVFGRPRPGGGLTLEEGVDISRSALRTRFRAKPGQADNFDVVTPDSQRAFIGQIIALVSAVVVPITAISLVVGGIVIMNIMLVSVTERTKEIGLRKAMGARRSDLMLQFLIEAAMMSSLGGLIGLSIGWVVTAVLSAIIGTELEITPLYVFISLFVSGATGILSGWYPASRAARLDPVVALRQE